MANTTSSESGLTIDQLRDRLKGAAPPKKKARPSVASDVRALLPEVRMKRAAGWTWEQIAAALYDDEAKASAIRTAYNRLQPAKGKGKGNAKSLTASKNANRRGGGGDAPPSAPCPSASLSLEKPASTAPSTAPMADQPAAARAPVPNLFGQLSDRGFGMNPHA